MIAHLSDTHLGARAGTGEPAPVGERLRAVLEQVCAMGPRPDVLLVTGDLADHGLPEEYAEARGLLAAWDGPMALCTGNHDVRDAFRAGLLDGGPTTAALAVGGHRFLMLDSLVDARDGVRVDPGHLTDESLAWLDVRLAEDDTPAYVCLHHPPVDIGLELMDPIRLDNPDALAAVLTRHPHVRATLVGHAHTMGATTFADRPLLIGGGVASGVTMDAEPQPALWYGAPPTYALHLVADDGRITTHWRAVAMPTGRAH